MRPSTSGAIVVNQNGDFAAGLLEYLRSLLPGERLVPCRPGETVPDDAEVLVTLNDGQRAFEGVEQLLAPQVRWIHLLSTGVDGFPFGSVGDRIITCSRGASATAIAEWVLAVMLAFEKQLPESWTTEPPGERATPILGGLAGRRVGVVGIGAIGSEVARRCLAFDMAVAALRRRQAPPPFPEIETAASLAELVGGSDHLVVAAPATPETRHLVGAEAFAAARAGLHLVNVARGSLVDQDALLVALDRGIVARASLDVTEPEPLPAGHPLYTHPRVRLSHHISWSAPGTAANTVQRFVDNLHRYRAAQPLEGLVDPVAGY